MKPIKLRKLNYESLIETKAFNRLLLVVFYIAIALLIIAIFIIKSGVK